MWRKRRRGCMVILIVGGVSGLLLAPIPLLLRLYTDVRYRGAIYALDAVPSRPVAIVLGARAYSDGRPSPMLNDRVRMGVALYHANKVERLLMTGDNSAVAHYQVKVMRDMAIALGVPAEAIIVDPKGYRTYDSCYRAVHTYAIEAAIVVTQAYHLDRALLLCDGMGIDAVGVAADDLRPNGYDGTGERRGVIREIPATVKAVLDLVIRAEP